MEKRILPFFPMNKQSDVCLCLFKIGSISATVSPERHSTRYSRLKEYELACDLVFLTHLRHDNEQDVVQFVALSIPYLDYTSGFLKWRWSLSDSYDLISRVFWGAPSLLAILLQR